MTLQRANSSDPLAIPGWAWQPFLDDAVAALQTFEPQPYPIEQDFLFKQGQIGSRAKPVTVTTVSYTHLTLPTILLV